MNNAGIHVQRTLSTALIAVSIVAACFAIGLGMQMRAQDAGGVGTIKTSYSFDFDVTDTSKLLDYADDAFVGEVVGVVEVEEERSTTVWRFAWSIL